MNLDDNTRRMDDLLALTRKRMELIASENEDEITSIKKQVRELEQRVDFNDFPRARIIAELFGLSELERGIVMYCWLQELDPEMGRVYSVIQDDDTSPFATARFFLRMLGQTVSDRLEITRICSGAGTLFHHRILRLPDVSEQMHSMPGSAPLRLERRILQFLCDSPELDARTYDVLSVGEHKRMDDVNIVRHEPDLKRVLSNYISATSDSSTPGNGILVLKGEYGTELPEIAAAISCARTGGYLRLRIDRLATVSEESVYEILYRCVREALLWEMELVVEGLDAHGGDGKALPPFARYLFSLREQYGIALILLTSKKTDYELSPEESSRFQELDIPIPSVATREVIWREALAGATLESNVHTPEELARRFKFTGGRIRAAAAVARDEAQLERDTDIVLSRENILQGCRSQSNRRLGDVAGKVEVKFGWSDIVLPEEQLNKLKEACNQVQYMEEVFDEWGFEKVIASGRGLNMLFSGPSGTGKTMAATIMAAELGLEMYKVDLSTVISKYIGETEKNLSRIFAEAETAHAILFFDEADAMFGKRSEVQSAHDRFANIEVGYLLQRMEEYTGITILATNLAENMDDAFLRRLQFMIEFPMPGPDERLEIWKKAVPPETTIAEDVDFPFLARKLQLSGANIKNILLQAAFHAVRSGDRIGMRDIVLGIQHEMQKESKPFLRADLGDYYDYLESDSIERKGPVVRGKGTRKAGLSRS